MSDEYKMGVSAWKKGLRPESNPFPSGNSGKNAQRVQWFDGYYDARIRQRIGPILKRWGLTW